MAELPFYPDAHPEETSVDGVVQVDWIAVGMLWADLIAEPGEASVDAVAAFYPVFIRSHASTTDYWSHLFRGIFLFDTSGLPDDAVITGAVLSLYGNAKVDDLGIAPDMNVYSSDPASNTGLDRDDFDCLGSIPLSTPIAYDDWITDGYNHFTLIDVDEDNFGYIKKGAGLAGITKLGVRNANYDVSGTPPAWTANLYSYLRMYFAEQGTIYRPKLVVTYEEVEVGLENKSAGMAAKMIAGKLI